MLRTATYFFIMIVSIYSYIEATIFDNRFVPFLQRPYIIVPDKDSHASVDAFFATASQAFGPLDREIGIPELTGIYNQTAVAKSFVSIGCANPLPSRFQDRKILWNANGKLEVQGIEFSACKHLASDYYAGFYWYFMRTHSVSDFVLNILESGLTNISRSDMLLLDRKRREMNAYAGLITNDHVSQVGFGDLDAYLMWEHAWFYKLKFRSIRAQASAGGLFPFGQSRDIYEPTSIPFGGDGFWGVYGAVQSEFELKEDWKVGAFFRASKRFKRTKLERIPLHCEPMPYAPLIAPVDINPGPTFVFMGWVDFENVHKGLGARVILTVRNHWDDDWDIACCDRAACCCVNSCIINELTGWGSDYITLNVFYDFSKIKVSPGVEPIIFFAWDIPSNMLVTRNVLKTNKIILGIECSF